MHSTGTDRATFLHNGDFSGDVTIVDESIADAGLRITVPFDNLEYIVAIKRMKTLISFIEDIPVDKAGGRALLERIDVAINTVTRG
jgi:hypothetical protein